MIKIFYYVLNCYIQRWLAKGSSPKTDRFGEISIAVVTMLGRMEEMSINIIPIIVIPCRHDASLVEFLINGVVPLVEGV